jgi:hypothetical protein
MNNSKGEPPDSRPPQAAGGYGWQPAGARAAARLPLVASLGAPLAPAPRASVCDAYAATPTRACRRPPPSSRSGGRGGGGRGLVLGAVAGGRGYTATDARRMRLDGVEPADRPEPRAHGRRRQPSPTVVSAEPVTARLLHAGRVRRGVIVELAEQVSEHGLLGQPRLYPARAAGEHTRAFADGSACLHAHEFDLVHAVVVHEGCGVSDREPHPRRPRSTRTACVERGPANESLCSTSEDIAALEHARA